MAHHMCCLNYIGSMQLELSIGVSTASYLKILTAFFCKTGSINKAHHFES